MCYHSLWQERIFCDKYNVYFSILFKWCSTRQCIYARNCMYTAISRKVVGKSAQDNHERYCGRFWVHLKEWHKRPWQLQCALIFFTIMFLLVGFILTIVGISAKRTWGPEDELRCSFCKEERMATEQNLKNCRIVGPIFLSATIIEHTSKPNGEPCRTRYSQT